MKIKILGCCGGQMPGKNNTAFLINNDTLLDAGTIALTLTHAEQKKVKNILVSHAHADHIGALPFYAVNIVSNTGEGVKIHGSAFTINAIKKHLMNGVLWPDFTNINNFGKNPIFSYVALTPGKWYNIGGYRVKQIPVHHTIPTNGFIIGHKNRYIVYSGDTKETSAIWKEAAKLGSRLKAVFVECSFPDKVRFLADVSAHLVPATIGGELKKLGPKQKPKVFVYHLKPEYIKEIKADLKKIKGYKITVVDEKKTYTI
jgi:ribonuclease BN (tRNA processing enzyme)